MRGLKLWILIVVLMAIVLLAIVLGAGFYYIISRPPAIESGTVVEVAVSGIISELPPDDPFTILLGSRVQNLWDLRRTFAAASEDRRVSAIYLKIHPMLASWAQIEELREVMTRFRSSGKEIHAFLAVDMATERELYLASAADRITLNPTASVLLNGLMAEVVFMKRTMDKIGVRPEFIYLKEYKNPDLYRRESMTPEIREMLVEVLADLQERFVRSVAADRAIDETQLRALMDIGILSAQRAQEEGLLDETGYEYQIRERLQALNGPSGYRSLSSSEYLSTAAPASAGKTQARVAVIGIVGTIVAGSSEPFAGLLGADTIAARLKEVREDSNYDGVLLRIDSPGGSAVASDMIWKEVQMLEESGKPVIVSMSGSAASGGYYVAVGANHIVSHPSTITGSIGVMFGKFDLSGLYDWLGMDIDRIKLAKNADLFSLLSSLTPEQRGLVEELMLKAYDDFVRKAAEGRQTTFEEFEPKAHGRVYTGAQAQEIDLVDQLGGYKAASSAMKEALGLAETDEIRLLLYPRPKTFWEALASNELLEMQAPASLHRLLQEKMRTLETPATWFLAPEIRIR